MCINRQAEYPFKITVTGDVTPFGVVDRVFPIAVRQVLKYEAESQLW